MRAVLVIERRPERWPQKHNILDQVHLDLAWLKDCR